MKITREQITDRNDFKSSIVLATVSKDDKLLEQVATDGVAELKMTVNDVEVDLEDYFNRWEDAINRSIQEKAEELVAEKMMSINDVLYNAEKAIVESIRETIGIEIGENY